MKTALANYPALAGFAAATMLLGIGFAMWIENGAALFISLAQAGLAWCL